MATIQMFRIVLTVTTMLAIDTTLIYAKPMPSWIWPSENNTNNGNRPNDTLAQEKVGATTPSDFIQPRALFTFGTRGTTALGTYQTRTFPTPSLPAVLPTVSSDCICVPFYFCDEGQVVSDGSGVIDIRQGWPCRNVLEVCCRRPHVTLAPIPSIPIQTTERPGEGGIIPGFTPKCGTLNPNGIHARILGFKDSEAQFGEYPYQAALLEQKMIAGGWALKFICGGSLIFPSVILTAAHCVQGRQAGHLIVRLGEWSTDSTSEFLPHQDLWGSEIVIHPLYYSGALLNDLALVFLQQAAVLAPHIDTICLPAQSPQSSFDGSGCWATGWGKNSFGHGGQYQKVLHEVELSLVPDNICAALLKNTSLGPRFSFHKSYLCAGGLKGKDTCVGDGGGPLVCPSLADPWRYVLAGITSWGVGCGTYKVPGVYVRVSEFTSWIETQVSLRVPSFNPRKIDAETTTKKENTTITRTAGPQQHI